MTYYREGACDMCMHVCVYVDEDRLHFIVMCKARIRTLLLRKSQYRAP